MDNNLFLEIMSVGYAVTGEHFGFCGPNMTRVLIDAHALCYQQRPHRCLWSVLHPEVMTISAAHAAMELGREAGILM